MKYSCLIISVLVIFSSCRKDKEIGPQYDNNGIDYVAGSTGVFVTCEGNFGSSSGSLSYINLEKDQISNSIFTTANQSSLGDVPVSMNIIDGTGYIVVNHSAKICIINLNDCKLTSVITGFTSPRYIVKAGEGKAYVSDLYSDSLRILNLLSGQITGYINIHRSSEEMILSGQMLFAANWSNYGKPTVNNDHIMVVDVSTDLLYDSIQVVKEPNSMVLDKNGKIWVLCSGGYDNAEFPALIRIDPGSKTIEQTFTFPVKECSPFKLRINATGDTLYFLNSGVFRMTINDFQLPSSPFIAGDGCNFYGLGINPATSDIFVSDAEDFCQQGNIFRYNAAGVLKSVYSAGVIPGEFCFR